MQALRWDGAAARVVEQPDPVRTAGMAVIRVTLAGVCATDLEIVKGYMRFRGVLGHEFVGTVEDGPSEWVRRRVVGDINFACGTCPTCRRGLGRHCPTRRVLGILGADGVFADRVALPVANLHLVPDTVADEVAVFTEPVAAAFEILEQIPEAAAMTCVVFGDGRLGLLIAQVLHQAGAHVTCVGRHPEKLAILGSRGIATVTADSWTADPVDLVVDATGSASGLEAAIAATRPRGILVMKTTVADRVPVDLSPLVINEITLVGSRCGRFPPALQALATDRIDVRSLIAFRRPLREGVDALRTAAQPGVLKVLIAPAE